MTDFLLYPFFNDGLVFCCICIFQSTITNQIDFIPCAATAVERSTNSIALQSISSADLRLGITIITDRSFLYFISRTICIIKWPFTELNGIEWHRTVNAYCYNSSISKYGPTVQWIWSPKALNSIISNCYEDLSCSYGCWI